MEINRIEFNRILTKLQAVMSTKDEEGSVYGDYIFTGDAIVGFNGKIVVSFPFETDFIGTIRGQELYKIVGKIKQETFSLRFMDNGVDIKTERIKARIQSGSTEDELVDQILKEEIGLPEVDDMEWKRLPKGFFAGCRLCLFCANTEEENKFVSGVQFMESLIISTDGSARISKYVMKGEFDENFILPANSLKELVKYDWLRWCYCGRQWIYFMSKDDGMIAAIRRLGGQYPDCSEYFTLSGVRMGFPQEEMALAIETAGIMTYDEESYKSRIKVIVRKKEIICEGKRQTGWVKVRVKAKMKIDEEFSFYINPIFFAEILTRKGEVYYGDGKIVFSSDTFYHLVSILQDGRK